MNESTDKRLIEVAFPLKQASLDSVHEKNVRHGHISTLHIWPARRPLAACRAALIATLLPDPGDPEKRKQILEKMAGRVVPKIERKKVGGRTIEVVKEETKGGILHWGRENGPDLDWFREEIRKAYGGRAPKVLDPFAGGGAIPLEAMRLGCDVTAIDINPVAWFILKCTLEYPQKLAGQTRPLPDFALKDREFMEAFLKAKGFKGASLRTQLERLGLGDGGAIQLDALPHDDPTLQADLAWHVRAWGRWVLAEARKELAPHYPTYADFEPLKPGKPYAPQPMEGVPTDADGIPCVGLLNTEYSADYLSDPRNPRWVAKPTVAYLWARTVKCKGCRATIPLLKTRWLCKKDNKRVLLAMEPNAERTGVVFGIETDVPVVGGNAAQRREHDKRVGGGTMSRTGATCPCCGMIMSMEDIRFEGRAGRLDAVITAVVVDSPSGKEYRLPTDDEHDAGIVSNSILNEVFAEVPFGLPSEVIVEDAKRNTWCAQYGFDQFRKLFTSRQLFSLGKFVQIIRSCEKQIRNKYVNNIWAEAITAYLAIGLDRLADRCSAQCRPDPTPTQSGVINTFSRFALPVVWDFAEGVPIAGGSGSFGHSLDWVSRFLDSNMIGSGEVTTKVGSALEAHPKVDVIVTDPPYYDAIGYSVLMDFFYVWLRRSTYGISDAIDYAFSEPLAPKWDHSRSDGELVDDARRFANNRVLSRENYEDGMARAFKACHSALETEGRFVVVFANKQPEAWETLLGALIRAGFVVDGSWPIQTEMGNRTRAMASAALASSVWLICHKRTNVRPGWDNSVLAEMRENITQKLRDFWDAGIRGPDFVWAATGPALEAFSKYPVVKKADDPGQLMTVSVFLREVRRMVVDFVVGRVLTHDGGEEVVSGLDDITTYYLLHRHDFGMDEAPIGACILYALSCNLSDTALVNQFDILGQSGKTRAAADGEEDEESEEDADDSGGSGAKVKLKAWNQRRGRNLGLEAPGGRPVPLIDQVHKLMHLWRAGEQVKVDDYLDTRGLKRNLLFHQVLQALIELSQMGSAERSILEALSKHVGARAGYGPSRQGQLV